MWYGGENKSRLQASQVHNPSLLKLLCVLSARKHPPWQAFWSVLPVCRIFLILFFFYWIITQLVFRHQHSPSILDSQVGTTCCSHKYQIWKVWEDARVQPQEISGVLWPGGEQLDRGPRFRSEEWQQLRKLHCTAPNQQTIFPSQICKDCSPPVLGPQL